MNSVCVVLDALLPVLGEVPQHFQRPHRDGDLILVCPDLHGNEHYTCVKLLFEDLPLKCTVNGRIKKDHEEDMDRNMMRTEGQTRRQA